MKNRRDSHKPANITSILDNKALDDYIANIEMEGVDVEVRRVHNNDSFLVECSSEKQKLQAFTTKDFHFSQLSIPRKPSWSLDMTAEEVDRREKNAFLQWRRNIASLEDANNGSMKVTPFEKNIEVWRQLWRVVERSDFLVQIVDARNPLLYYTSDLSAYAAEKDRHMMLLINKADLLTDFQRICWARYFRKEGVRCVFYSAKSEQAKLDKNEITSSVDVDEVEAIADVLATGWGIDLKPRSSGEWLSALLTWIMFTGDAVRDHRRGRGRSTANTGRRRGFRLGRE